jgi:hypothetical protein
VNDSFGKAAIWDLTSHVLLGYLPVINKPLSDNPEVVEEQTALANTMEPSSDNVALSPDGQTVMIFDAFSLSCSWWNIRTWTEIQPLDSCDGVTLSPDGRFLAATYSSKIELWNVETHTRLWTVDLSGFPEALAFRADSQALALLDSFGRLVLLNVKTGKRDKLLDPGTLDTTGNGPDCVHECSLSFNPQGILLILSTATTVEFWDVSSGQQLTGPDQSGASMNNSVLSPDGQYLAQAQSNGAVTVRFATVAGWQAQACRGAGRNFTQEEWGQFFGTQPYDKTCPDFPAGT